MMFSSSSLDVYSSGFSSGSFWGSGGDSLFGSALDQILEKEPVSLEEILDEDTTIQEAKGMNEKLLEFLQKESTIDKLLSYLSCTDFQEFKTHYAKAKQQQSQEENACNDDAHAKKSKTVSVEDEAAKAAALIVQEGEEEEEEEEAMEERFVKFPFVACEILCCNLTQVLQPFVNSTELLNKFFGILDQNAPLDSRLSGYFFKVLSVLLRRAPEKLLWFSVYRNVDISDSGKEGGIDKVGWLMPKLLQHIDSYSITCSFKAFLQVAAEEAGVVGTGEEEDDDDNSFTGFGGQFGRLSEPCGDLDGRADGEEESRSILLRSARSVWLGGSGAALAILNTLAASDNSDSHSNAAELLVDMLQRAAMARLNLQAEEDTVQEGMERGKLPSFSGLVLLDRGSGASAETAMIESGCEWTLRLCEELVSVALFESKAQQDRFFSSNTDSSEPAEPRVESDELSRIVERGSAAIAALQVLTHLVNAFSLDRWSEPLKPAQQKEQQDGGVVQETSRLTTAEKHGDLPPEIRTILTRLPDLVHCLSLEKHCDLFQMEQQVGNKTLGIHRLKIIELLCTIIHTRYPEAIESIAECESNPMAAMLDAFFHFEWNNCLHSVIERTLQFILLGGISEESMGFDSNNEGEGEEDEFFEQMNLQGDDSDPNDSHEEEAKYSKRIRRRQEEIVKEQLMANTFLRPLHLCLFEKCSLIQLLIQAYAENERCLEETEQFLKLLEDKEAKRDPSIRSSGTKGYMGYCHRIVNSIALVAATQRNEKESLLENQKQNQQQQQQEQEGSRQQTTGQWAALQATDGNNAWVKLLQDEIAQVNAIEQCLLGGARPRGYSSPASEGVDNDMDDVNLVLDRNQILQKGSGLDDTDQYDFRDYQDDEDDESDDDFNPFASNEIYGDADDQTRHERTEEEEDEDPFGMLAAESVSSDTDDQLSSSFEKVSITSSVKGHEDNDDHFDPFAESDGDPFAELATSSTQLPPSTPAQPPPAQPLKDEEDEEDDWEPAFES